MLLRRTVALCTLAAAIGALAPAAGTAYRFHAVKWPGGVIPYFNAAPDQAWAVGRAARAWNESGARIRFVAVPRAQARLVIGEDARKVYCAEGHASLGYVPGARVVVFPAHGITHACNRYWAVHVLAHELGHVLGLEHEDRACATMNSTGTFRGGTSCEPKRPWEWRCRLLEPDDVAGVAAVYGGRPRPSASPATCPLYAPIERPSGLSASYDATGTVLTVVFGRPGEPAIPSFVAPPQARHNAAFALTRPTRRCPEADAVSSAYRYRWHVPARGRQHLRLAAPSERLCIAVWAVDALGRPSAGPTRIIVDPPRAEHAAARR